MNIVVCVKQVPDTTEVKIDPVTNTLMRQGVPSIVNPFDKHALEAALGLRETHGGKVTVLSMGPPQAQEALRECLAMGADAAVLLSDRAFGGADTLATSHTLAAGIQALGPVDLVLCGKQAIDGDTAQVGPEMAEHLDIPQATNVAKITVAAGKCIVEREQEEGYDVWEISLPALVTVVKSINEPRLPSVKGSMKARKQEISLWTAENVLVDAARIGLNGSPTQVRKIFTPQQRTQGEIIRGENAQDAAALLMEKLAEAKLV